MPAITVTDEHRLAAFTSYAWANCTLDEAMADPTRRRLIEFRAAWLARREHDAQHAPQTLFVRRYDPATKQWRMYRHAGPRTVPTIFNDDEENSKCAST
jgi:hypothetical protein